MQLIHYQVADRIAKITLNRPEKRNALSAQLVTELKTCFTKAAKDDEVKVVILQANGSSFCAGADLAYLQELQRFSHAENLADSNHLKELFLQIYEHPKPVIAQVQGHALAGGAGLVAVCDFAYTVPNAKFGYTEVKIGFVPALVSVFLIRKIGEAKAIELLLSGELISAESALTLSLVQKVCEPEALEREVMQLAQSLIRGNSGTSMRLTKQLIRQVQDMSLQDALQLAAETNAEARASEDCKKGIAAFLTKSPINW